MPITFQSTECRIYNLSQGKAEGYDKFGLVDRNTEVKVCL
jgi:hypothetical protein